MEKLHTPEPWDLFGHAIHKGGECLVYLNGCSLANARRIVACVNACAGIETERLETANSCGSGFWGKCIHDSDVKYSELAILNKTLTAQRDELLAALRALYGWTKAEVEHFGATCPDDFIIEMVEKALKNA